MCNTHHHDYVNIGCLDHQTSVLIPAEGHDADIEKIATKHASCEGLLAAPVPHREMHHLADQSTRFRRSRGEQFAPRVLLAYLKAKGTRPTLKPAEAPAAEPTALAPSA